jgi:hypothetical protein
MGERFAIALAYGPCGVLRPVDSDPQTPHDQDVYLSIGTGELVIDRSTPVQRGDSRCRRPR